MNRFGIVEKDIYKAVKSADAIVLMTAHNEFKKIDFKMIKSIMRTRIVIDGRRYPDNQRDYMKLGFTYKGVGAINKT